MKLTIKVSEKRRKIYSDSIVHVRVFPTASKPLTFELSGVHWSEYAIDIDRSKFKVIDDLLGLFPHNRNNYPHQGMIQWVTV